MARLTQSRFLEGETFHPRIDPRTHYYLAENFKSLHDASSKEQRCRVTNIYTGGFEAVFDLFGKRVKQVISFEDCIIIE